MMTSERPTTDCGPDRGRLTSVKSFWVLLASDARPAMLSLPCFIVRSPTMHLFWVSVLHSPAIFWVTCFQRYNRTRFELVNELGVLCMDWTSLQHLDIGFAIRDLWQQNEYDGKEQGFNYITIFVGNGCVDFKLMILSGVHTSIAIY